MPKYIVIRQEGHSLDGRWYDFDRMTKGKGPLHPPGSETFGPTDEWERRDDGALAQVYRKEA